MAQEFTIKSEAIETKINQLLPTQGGFQPGVDFSASTMVIPIIDLTETAEGSSLRQDLQTAIDLNVTTYDISNSTASTIIATTGYYRLFGTMSNTEPLGPYCFVELTSGITSKKIINSGTSKQVTNVGFVPFISYDIVVKVSAGESITGTSPNTSTRINGIAKQIADLSGNLT